MRNSIIDKSLILIILTLVLFTSCKNEKTCDIYDLVQRIYEGENISVLDNVINFKIDRFSPLKDGVVCGGAGFLNNHADCLWFFSNTNDYTHGMIITLVYTSIKGKKWEKTQDFYLKDYKYIPGFSKNKIQYGNVSYGEPQIDKGGKHYKTDENIFGIYAYEGKTPPYYKEVKPKYLVYVENNKLVVEEPKDDKYFIYRIPEL